MKQNILVLTSTYPRWQGDTQPVFVHELARRLTSDYYVHVLAPHYPNAELEQQMDGVAVHRFRYWIPSHQRLAYDGGILTNIRGNRWLIFEVPLYLLSQWFSAFVLIRKHDIKLIHAHWVIPQGFVAMFLRLLRRDCVLVVTPHGADVYALRGRALNLIKSLVYRVADAVTVVSRAMAETVSGCLDKKKLSIAPMGVDLETAFVVTHPIELRQDVIFIGRLVEKKGAAVLLKAFSGLLKNRSNLHLTIVGDGPEKATLLRLADDISIADHLRFLGAVPNSKIPDILNQHAIAVVPSIVAASGDQEGLGLVSIEAMGCGCAVVASDLPAIRDVLINEQNGLMFEPGNSEALKKALTNLLDNDDLRCGLAIRGHQDAKRLFDWSRSAERYKQIFAGLL